MCELLRNSAFRWLDMCFTQTILASYSSAHLTALSYNLALLKYYQTKGVFFFSQVCEIFLKFFNDFGEVDGSCNRKQYPLAYFRHQEAGGGAKTTPDKSSRCSPKAGRWQHLKKRSKCHKEAALLRQARLKKIISFAVAFYVVLGCPCLFIRLFCLRRAEVTPTKVDRDVDVFSQMSPDKRLLPFDVPIGRFRFDNAEMINLKHKQLVIILVLVLVPSFTYLCALVQYC